MNLKKVLKKSLSITTVICMILTSVSCAFTDLTSDHWAYDIINEMVDNDVMTGYNDGTFKPEKLVTRAEFATLLVKALKLEGQGSTVNFKDVEGMHWAEEYIDLANPYLTGYIADGEYYFKPEEIALREDAAVALVRAKGLTGGDINVLNQFVDKQDISENLTKYIAIAVENELMSGYLDRTFKPQQGLTRAEVAALFSKIYVKEDIYEYEKIAIGEIIKEKLPEFKLNERDMTIDLGKDFKKYEFTPSGHEKYYWYSAANSSAVKNNKIVLTSLNSFSWDTETSISIREKNREDKGIVKVDVPRYKVTVRSSNGVSESHKFIPLQKVQFVFELENDEKFNEITKTFNIDKEDITIEKSSKFVILKFVMPDDDVKIEINTDTFYEDEIDTNLVEVESIKINYPNLKVSLGGTATFKAEVKPANSTNKEIIWKSSNENIATIDKNGEITPNGVGQTIITAKSSNGKTATCKLDIYALKYDSTLLDVGETECIVHGADKLNSFVSSNPKIASVDQMGNVTATSAGETVITAKDNNNRLIKCVITVKDDETVLEPIVLAIQPLKKTLYEDDTITLNVKSGKLQGSEVIIWEFELDGQQIATNSGYSMKVSKLIEIASRRYKGDLYNKEIILKAFPRDVRDNSDRETSIFKIKLMQNLPEPEITISRESLELEVGEKKKLSAKISDEDLFDDPITWMSSNENIATVSSDGLVIAKKAGSVEIIACYNGNLEYSARCKVNVIEEEIISEIMYGIVMLDDYKEKVGSTVSKFVELLTTDGTERFEVADVNKDYFRNQEDAFVDYKLIGLKLKEGTMLIYPKFFDVKDTTPVSSYLSSSNETKLAMNLGNNTVKGNFKVIDIKRDVLVYEDEEFETTLGEIYIDPDAIVLDIRSGEMSESSISSLENEISDGEEVYVVPFINSDSSEGDANVLVIVE